MKILLIEILPFVPKVPYQDMHDTDRANDFSSTFWSNRSETFFTILILLNNQMCL